MKVANFVTGLISSVVMMAGDFLVFCISFVASLLGLMFYSSSSADHETIDGFFVMFALSIGIFVIAIASLVLSIVAFVAGRKPGHSQKKYNALSITLCVITLIANICALPLVYWVTDLFADTAFYYCWPVIGFILLIVMVILTVVNAISSGKKAAA